jgi:hypothetical protein
MKKLTVYHKNGEVMIYNLTTSIEEWIRFIYNADCLSFNKFNPIIGYAIL